jgi:hypothetical protein
MVPTRYGMTRRGPLRRKVPSLIRVFVRNVRVDERERNLILSSPVKRLLFVVALLRLITVDSVER